MGWLGWLSWLGWAGRAAWLAGWLAAGLVGTPPGHR